MGETVKDYVQTTREPLPNGRPNGRGAGVREPAAGQKTGRAPPERPHPHPVALRATRPLPVGLPDSHMSASRSSLPPLGEAEWRGGVGVGGGWARRAGDEDDAAVGPGQPSTPAPDRRRSASGKRPPPRSGFARVGPPRRSLRERTEGGGAPRRPSMCEYRSPQGRGRGGGSRGSGFRRRRVGGGADVAVVAEPHPARAFARVGPPLRGGI